MNRFLYYSSIVIILILGLWMALTWNLHEALAYGPSDVFCASGFDSDPTVNGTYTYYGPEYINNQYSNGDFYLTGDVQYGQGYLSPNSGGPMQWYDNGADIGATVYEGTYAEAYVHPGYPSGAVSGEVTLGECPEEEPPTETATSTIPLSDMGFATVFFYAIITTAKFLVPFLVVFWIALKATDFIPSR